MSGAYLELAKRAILHRKRPMSPTEMLHIAKKEGFLPAHLHGATMHKTLTARLSEEVRKNGEKSDFFRTDANVFFLYSLALQPDTPPEFTQAYEGFKRSKTIRKEDVLVADRTDLKRLTFGDFINFNEKDFYNFFINYCSFEDRAKAEKDHTIKQFVTFTLVFHKNMLLTYTRGKFTTTSETLKGQKTVGFGGHVNITDFDLFHRGGEAFKSNAARELREELYLDDIYRDFRETLDRTRILGYINVDGDFDAEHHIAVLIAFQHDSPELPKRGELAITRLSWLDLSEPPPNYEQYDFWSKIILRKIFSNNLTIVEDQ